MEHGSNEWFEALDQHFKWLLQYKISPYFCRWGDSMRVLTYTCPWPGTRYFQLLFFRLHRNENPVLFRLLGFLLFLLYILVSLLSIFCPSTMAVLRYFLKVNIQLLLHFIIVYTKLVLFMLIMYDSECVLNHFLQLIIRKPMNTTQTQGWQHTLFLMAL